MNIISFNIDIETTNAAFDENAEMEVARILRDIASKLESGIASQNIRDFNGNTIGQFYAELNYE